MRKLILVLVAGLLATACSSSQDNELSEARQEIEELENKLESLEEFPNEETEEEIFEEIELC